MSPAQPQARPGIEAISQLRNASYQSLHTSDRRRVGPCFLNILVHCCVYQTRNQFKACSRRTSACGALPIEALNEELRIGLECAIGVNVGDFNHNPCECGCDKPETANQVELEGGNAGPDPSFLRKHSPIASEEQVYSRLHFLNHALIALTFGMTSLLAANSQIPAQRPAGTSASVVGHITDPTGALLPGAKITVSTTAGAAVASTTSDSGGAYKVSGLVPGGFVIQAASEGFAPAFSPAFQLTAGQTKRVDIAMATVVEQQSVTVTDEEAPMVSVEASGNTSSIVLKDKDLDSLSDDPDELSNELTALAGPSAGPNGGEVYISGFTGGQLPPKSAIREIRINQNPYSSEFDHLGYGRIEILTKPGTDDLHGRFFMQGNDDAFNTGNPFTTAIPSYHSIQYNGSLSGSLSKSASYFLSVDQRNNQNASIYSVTTAVLNPSTNSTRRAQFRADSSARRLTQRYRRASISNLGRRTLSPCATSLNATARAGV